MSDSAWCSSRRRRIRSSERSPFPDGKHPISEETARAVDEEVRRIVPESFAEAQRLLTEHRRELDALAQALLQRETLDESEVLAATGLTRAPALRSRSRCRASRVRFRLRPTTR